MHNEDIRRYLDEVARFAERLSTDWTTDPIEARVFLGGDQVGRVRFDRNDSDWVVDYWTGSAWETCLSRLLSTSGDTEGAEQHGVGAVAEALAEGLAKPRAS